MPERPAPPTAVDEIRQRIKTLREAAENSREVAEEALGRRERALLAAARDDRLADEFEALL